MPFDVLVSTRFFDGAAEQLLRDNGCDVRRTGLPDDVQDDVLDAGTLDRLLAGADGWILGTAPATRESFRRAAAAELERARPVAGNEFKVTMAQGVMVSVLAELAGLDEENEEPRDE